MTAIMEYFKTLPDPRLDRKKLHRLDTIIFITIAAVICGAEDWDDIAEYGDANKDWLNIVLDLPNGTPSHDTFNRVFSLLDAEALEQRFVSWIQSVAQISEGRIISIDGKRLCNSGEDGSKAIIHMVSAWSNANNMVLGQQKVNDKSNEITAIPALLKIIDIKGCTVTIDAMGCQQDIATLIIDKEADYILAVKGNQEHLYDDIKEAFEQEKAIATDVKLTMGHGRIEKRTCSMITNTDWVCKEDKWAGLQTLIKIESERTQKATGAFEKQTRYYIASGKGDAAFFNQAIREHWGIENKLHWLLDVAFGEDASNKRAGKAAQNFSCINKIALNLLQNYDDRRGAKKLSIKTKRKKCGWSKEYLLTILKGADKF